MKVVPYAALLCWIAGAALFTPEASRASSPADSPHSLEAAGLDHFYSLEYDQAIATFQKLRDAEPENPTWRNHLAWSYLYKQLLIAGVLQGDMFSSSNRFFRTKKIEPDPALDRNFRENNNDAIRICEGRLMRNGRDQEALYACGVAFAARSADLGLIQRAKLDTLSNARRADAYHSELIHQNPQFNDAYLISGLYDYVLGSLPGSLKFLLLLSGFAGGNKDRGLQSVERVAEMGDRAKQDARILLAVLYRREKRYPDARRILDQLASAFPRNYVFPLEIASLDRVAGKNREAIREYEQVLEWIHGGRPGFAGAPAARIHFELGDLYSQAGDPQAAKTQLAQVSGSLGSNPELEQETDEILRRIDAAHPPQAAAP